MEDNNGYGGGLGWLLVGAVAGACTALLLAPATGKRTRERLARKLRDTRESVTEFTDDIADRTRHITDDLADKTRYIAERAGQISDKAARLAEGASAAARDVVGSLSDQTERTAKRS